MGHGLKLDGIRRPPAHQRTRAPRERGGGRPRPTRSARPPRGRCDRNLVELLQEVRVVQTGVQVLFAFLLTAPLAQRFPELTSFQRYDYFLTLLSARAAGRPPIPPPRP